MVSFIAAMLIAAMQPAPGPPAEAQALAARAAAVAVPVGTPLGRFRNLSPGTRSYLRYRMLNGVWRPVDIWRREIRFEERDGQRRLHIVQSWTGPTASVSNLAVDSWFEAETFAPISHERRSVRGEEVRNEGFLFAPERIVGLPTTPDNVRADFTLNTPVRSFNFETDMELVQALPLAANYAARVPFYHPGGAPPSDWIVRVTGSTLLPTAGGPVVCWVVAMEAADGAPMVAGRFFVAKQGQAVLRVEQPMPGGMIVKVLIDAGAPIPA